MERRRPRAVLHVDQSQVRWNTKHPGDRRPPITVQELGKSHKAWAIEILGPDNEVIAEVVYSPDKPLSCGARVWVELGAGADYRLRQASEPS